MATKKDYVVGSGNVFADLGYARPEEAAAKAELAHKITKIIERRKLTQAEAANVLEVDQPKVSALGRGKLTAGGGRDCLSPSGHSPPFLVHGRASVPLLRKNPIE